MITQLRLRCWLTLWLCLGTTGCISTGWIRERHRPALPLATDLDLFSWRGPRATPRTAQLLRRYDLSRRFDSQPESVLPELMDSPLVHSSPEHVFSIAEVAFIAGRIADTKRRLGDALDLYSISVAHAYAYLMNEEFDAIRNPYDPQFRQASDLYNAALESTMRVVARQGELRPGTTHVIRTRTQEYELHIVSRGTCPPEDIADLKFVSDYDLQGLKNHYRTYGLGVPLIAIYRQHGGRQAVESYYAPGMSVPMTAFLRVLPDAQEEPGANCVRHVCVLELHDSLRSTDVTANGRLVPLETDLSTPLAYSLNAPAFQQTNTATRGLLNPAKSQEHQGLYLLEPFDPDKIPVLMIHGLWSDLVTWMEMFNDLRRRRRDSRPIPILVLSLPQWAATADHCHTTASRVGAGAATVGSTGDQSDVGPNDPCWPQYGRLGCAPTDDGKWRGLLEHAFRHSPVEARCAGIDERRPETLALLSRQSCHQTRHHDCFATSRQRVFQQRHAVAGS